MQGSQTLGKTKKKTSQRHSAGTIDYEDGQDADDHPAHGHAGFRTRSRTVGDAADRRGKFYPHNFE